MASNDHVGAARRRRRREALLVGGSKPLVGWSPNRSIRMTGSMITVAAAGSLATVLESRAGCAGKLMTVPISISPGPNSQRP
jgi:hypothetical protein